MSYPISDVPRRIVYSGSAGVGPYAFTFEVLTASDIAVYKNQTLLTLTTDYTVSINTGTGTGTVTLVVAATGADTVTLVGDRAIQRASDFVTGGDLFANTLNAELDAQTIYAQQIDEKAERAIRAPVTDPTTLNMVLPSASDRASKYLAFSSTGDPIATAGSSSTNPVSVTMEPFVQASTLEAARTILGISDGAVTAAKIERVAANQVLRSTGVSTDPAWGALNLTTDVTGTLPVANGGTGAATLTANSVLLGNGTSALQEVAPGTDGNVLTASSGTWVSSTPIKSLSTEVFAATTTWTAPAGITQVRITAVGGGAGGGGIGNGNGGFGGFMCAMISVTPTTLYTVTIGDGGAGTYVDGAGGTPGGETWFGVNSGSKLVSCTGGSAGTTGTNGANGTSTTTGTTIRSGNANSLGSYFGGNTNYRTGAVTALAWSVSEAYAPGTSGRIETAGFDTGGGVGGAIMLEYVG